MKKTKTMIMIMMMTAITATADSHYDYYYANDVGEKDEEDNGVHDEKRTWKTSRRTLRLIDSKMIQNGRLPDSVLDRTTYFLEDISYISERISFSSVLARPLGHAR